MYNRFEIYNNYLNQMPPTDEIGDKSVPEILS